MKRLTTVILFLALGLPSVASAQYNLPGQFLQETPTSYRSVRALGMGNAHIAIKGNRYSPFYNPAGLNDLEESEWVIFSPTLEISKSSFQLVGDISDLIDDIDAADTDAGKVGALDQFVTDRFGEFSYTRLGIHLISYLQKNFAAGALLNQRIQFSFRDQSLPKFDVQNITDLMFYVSGAYGFFEDALQVGLTFRPTLRTSVQERITPATAIADEVDDVFQTLIFPHLGFGLDAGVKSDLNIPGLMEFALYKEMHELLKPSVGLTWQNIGGTPFKTDLRSTDGNESGVEDPAKFEAAVGSEPVKSVGTVSMGANVSPKILFLDTNFSVDIRDLNEKHGFVTHLNLGAEVIFPTILSARIGLNQGYITAGLGADLWVVDVNLATYAQEVGTSSRQGSDRRYAITFDFNI